MFGLIFLLLIVVPIVELYVLFQVADSFGWGVSLLSLLLISLAGGALMRWQTSGAWGRIVAKIQSGEMPSKELADGALMIFGGSLLLTPGFFTDAIGLAMFIPPLRALARGLLMRRLNARVTTISSTGGGAFGATFMSSGGFPGGFGGPRRGGFIDVDEVDVERLDDDPPQLPTTQGDQ